MENDDSIFSDLDPTETEGSYTQRILAYMVDWVIEVLLVIMIYILVPKEMIYTLLNNYSYSMYIVIFGLMFLYRAICIFSLGKTIGMLICKIKYLNSSLQPLSSKEKVIAVFVTRTSAIRFYKEL